MKLHADKPDTHTITSYGEGWIEVNGQRFDHSLIVSSLPGATATIPATLWNVEVTELTLSDASAEAAFRLASVCSESGKWMEEDEEDDFEIE